MVWKPEYSRFHHQSLALRVPPLRHVVPEKKKHYVHLYAIGMYPKVQKGSNISIQ